MDTRIAWALAGALLCGAANATPVTFDFGVLAPNSHPALGSGVTTYGINTALTFTNSGPGTVAATIGASAVNSPSRYWALTQRDTASEGTGEAGLGVVSTSDITSTPREIGKDEFLLLDYSDVLAKGGKVLSITIGSIQAHGNKCEGFELFASNTKPTSFAAAKSGTFVEQSGTPGYCGDELAIVDLSGIWSKYKYFSVTALQLDNPNGVAVYSPDNDVTVGTTVVDLPNKNNNPPPVPEPATLALFGMGLLGLFGARKRRS